jgi:hypothetical protein
MIIYLINNKPHTSISNGFNPVDAQTYYMMLEQGEIDHTEVVDYE